jgi:DNA invertase Pin-like site-specific DNA recombinase
MTVFEINNKIEEALNPTIDKYAMYLRKSRADLEAEKDGEGETLARHRKILTDLAVRKGLYVEKIYEEVVSGETIEARSEIQSLIKDCYAGKYKGIIVMDISRLSRGNQGDAQTILDCLKFSNTNRGILVVTPSKTYDIAHNHDDEEYMEFELFMSRREYKMIKRRLDRGKEQAVVEGNYIASYRPFGYDIVKYRKTRTLVPNEYEAPYVKMMYDMAVKDNAPLMHIADRLQALGVKPIKADSWSSITIRRMLRNPVYAGKIKWRERVRIKTMEGDKVKTKISSHTDQYMIYDGKHEALVDMETYEAVLKRFPNPKVRSNFKLINPLAGMVRCQKCGIMFRYKKFPKSKDRITHDNKYVDCKVKSALIQDVMEALKHALKLHIEDFEIKLNATDDIDEDKIHNDITTIQSEIRKMENRKSKLFDGWEAGTITDNEFVERKTVIAERIENMKLQIIELEESIPQQIDYKDKIATLHQTIDMINDRDFPIEDLNEYLRKVIDRIEFSRENINEFILDIFLK